MENSWELAPSVLGYEFLLWFLATSFVGLPLGYMVIRRYVRGTWPEVFEDAGNRTKTRLTIAIANAAASLFAIITVRANLSLVWILLSVCILRLVWLMLMYRRAEELPAYAPEPTQKQLNWDWVNLALILVTIGVVWPLCAGYAQKNAIKSAVTFHDTLPIGAAFDQADFARRVEAGGGRVRNFGNRQEAMEATGITDALWDRRTLYPIEVAVLAENGARRYHMWFRTPDTWRTVWGSMTSTPVDYIFTVKNGKIAGKSGIGDGDSYILENGGWVRRAGGRAALEEISSRKDWADDNQSTREEAERRASHRNEAEAFYATLRIGSTFDRADFEWRIAAMGGRVVDIDNGDRQDEVTAEELKAKIEEMRNDNWHHVVVRTESVRLSNVVGYYAVFADSVESTGFRYFLTVANGTITFKQVWDREQRQWRKLR
jgi:hypothetical protein